MESGAAELIGIGGLAGAGIVIALVAVLRQTVGEDIIKDRFTPGLAILIGIGWNALVKLDAVPTEESTWLGTVLLGILTGLSASGAWSSVKAMVNNSEPL